MYHASLIFRKSNSKSKYYCPGFTKIIAAKLEKPLSGVWGNYSGSSISNNSFMKLTK